MRLLSSLILLFLSLSLLHAQDRKSPHYRQAVENARLDAQRNLAETLLGILIEFGTEIKDFRSRRDFILATVQGKLQGVSFSAPSYEERSGILRIRAQISRSDALEALKASEIDAGSSLPETIDALGEAIYEEPPLVPALDPNDSSTSTPPSPLDENTSTSPVLALRPLAFELPYQELLDILMYKLELSWTKSEQEEILKVLRSRSKVYLGLETSGGLQLQLRLESLAIELILQAYVWDYELYERALHFSKIHFKKGILLTCLLRGNQIFPLSNRLSSWYEAPLELTYRLAQYLSGSAEKAPSQRLLKQLEEGATFYFEYYRDRQEVFLSFQVLPEKVSLLCEGLSPEEQSLLKDQIGQGLEMKGVVYGELITADIAWITLGQEILCQKATFKEFNKPSFLQAKQTGQRRAENLVLDFLAREGFPLQSLPPLSPLFQGLSQGELVLQYAYSQEFLKGFLLQRYSDLQLEPFLEKMGKGVLVWVSVPF